MFCVDCGKKNVDSAKFCFDCGKPLLNDSVVKNQNKITILPIKIIFTEKQKEQLSIMIIIIALCFSVLSCMIANNYGRVFIASIPHPGILEPDMMQRWQKYYSDGHLGRFGWGPFTWQWLYTPDPIANPPEGDDWKKFEGGILGDLEFNIFVRKRNSFVPFFLFFIVIPLSLYFLAKISLSFINMENLHLSSLFTGNIDQLYKRLLYGFLIINAITLFTSLFMFPAAFSF